MLSLWISGLERIWRMDCAGENRTNGWFFLLHRSENLLKMCRYLSQSETILSNFFNGPHLHVSVLDTE